MLLPDVSLTSLAIGRANQDYCKFSTETSADYKEQQRNLNHSLFSSWQLAVVNSRTKSSVAHVPLYELSLCFVVFIHEQLRIRIRLSARPSTTVPDEPLSTSLWRLIKAASSIRYSMIPGCSAMHARSVSMTVIFWQECCIKTLTDLMTFVDICWQFPLYSHIHCLVAVCKPFIKVLLTYLLTYLRT